MSDKPKEKKADAAPAEGDAHGAKKGGVGALLTKLPVLLGVVMVIEAAVLFGAFKMLGASPKPAEGAELHAKADGHGDEEDEGAADAHGAAPAAGAHGDAKGAAGPVIKPKGKYALT